MKRTFLKRKIKNDQKLGIPTIQKTLYILRISFNIYHNSDEAFYFHNKNKSLLIIQSDICIQITFSEVSKYFFAMKKKMIKL